MNEQVFEKLPMLVSVQMTAKILGISRSAAYSLANAEGVAIRRLGRRMYVVTESLRDYCAP